MTDTTTANAWEEGLIADARANGGHVTQGPLAGDEILVLYSIGAKTGDRRRAILSISRDGDAYVVAGTAGGSPTTPGWLVNLEANPDIEFEFGDQTHHGHAEVLREGPERDRLWIEHVTVLPRFAAYPEQTGRVIPIARITTTD
jgi:deazaflavin-dependent oxidoreductase (nitroreductase family)